MRNHAEHFFARGWCQFDFDPRLYSWVEAALAAARATLSDPRQEKWLRYQGTWFAGVNALPNDALGEVDGSGPLRGAALAFIAAELGLCDFAWDAAQISICYPGYPLPMAGESPGRARYRRVQIRAHFERRSWRRRPKSGRSRTDGRRKSHIAVGWRAGWATRTWLQHRPLSCR